MFKFTKKRAAVLGVVASFAIAAAAVAYFTSTGTGTGSATVGTAHGLTITQTGSVTGLTPGSAAVPVTYTIANPTGNGAQTLGTVSISNILVTKAANATGTCTAADFTQTTSTNSVGKVADGATFTSDAGTEPSIQMVDSSSNQDGCQGASLSFTLSAAQGS